MKLTLTNFGVWGNEKVFEFPDNGLTLISGPSGKGKTTILRGINYALTGEGTKLPTLGEKKCTVVFEYHGMVITRSNTPSKLTVLCDGILYEANEAQSLIYQTIGKNFEIAGYIQQKGENSFLVMTPADKLRFLEKVAFSDVPIDEIKENARQIVSSAENALLTVQGELKYLSENTVRCPEEFGMTRDEIHQLRNSLKESIDFLSKKKTQTENDERNYRLLKQQIADIIFQDIPSLPQSPQLPFTHSELREKLSSLEKNLHECEEKKASLEKERLTLLEFSEKEKSLLQRLSDLHEENVPEEIVENNEENFLEEWKRYTEYQQEKNIISQLREYVSKHNEEMKKIHESLQSIEIETPEEQSQRVQEIQELTEALQQFYHQQERAKLIASYDAKSHQQTIQRVESLEQQLRLLIQSKEARACPKCHANLLVLQNTLELFPHISHYSDVKEKELRLSLKEAKKELTSFELLQRKIEGEVGGEVGEEIGEEIELDPKEVQDYISELKELSSIYEEKKKRFDELSLRKTRCENENTLAMNSRILEFDQKVEPSKPEISQSELQSRIFDRKKRLLDIQRILSENSEKRKKIDDLTRLLESIHSKLGTVNCTQEYLEESLVKTVKDIEFLRRSLKECSEYSRKFDNYNRDCEEIQRKIDYILGENEVKRVKKENLIKELSKISSGDSGDPRDFLKEIALISDELEESRRKHLECIHLEHQRTVYESRLSEYKNFLKNESRLRESLQEAEKKFTLAKKFRESVATAEMLALNSLIEEINSHISVYLSVFFPDNPITLDLCLFKANEKTKIVRNQINIQIGYRGALTDLTTLSGGEKDRVNLAFTLALAEIFNIPLLMLDETLSSLDRESTESVLEHIQKESRSILVVAHQVSHGLFDHVYSI